MENFSSIWLEKCCFTACFILARHSFLAEKLQYWIFCPYMHIYRKSHFGVWHYFNVNLLFSYKALSHMLVCNGICVDQYAPLDPGPLLPTLYCAREYLVLPALASVIASTIGVEPVSKQRARFLLCRTWHLHLSPSSFCSSFGTHQKRFMLAAAML